LGSSLVVGLVSLWTLETLQLKYALAFTLSLLVFSLTSLYKSGYKSFSVTLTRANIGVKIWWLSWFLAILVAIVIRPLETSSQFLDWNEIPVPIWLRLIAIFSLTTIYPGYGLTMLIVRGQKLNLLENTVFSILLSIFISSTVAFVGILFDQSIGNLGFFSLISVNIFLLVLTSYLARHNLLSKKRTHYVVSIKPNDITRSLSLLFLIAFVLLSIYSVNVDKFVPTIDQWVHYGNILRGLNGTFFSFVPGVYWFYMHTGLFVYGAGAPFINAYMVLSVLCFIPILCFYLMCSVFWDKSKALVATTVYTLLSGFGGVYANYLRLSGEKDLISIIGSASEKTYDISAGAVSFSFYIFPKLIGYSTLFTIIYLIYNQRLPRLGRIILVSAIFALGYLTHAMEMYFFLIVTTFLTLVFRKHVSDLKNLLYGLILGLFIVATVDLLAPQKTYGFYYLLMGHLDIVPLGLVGIVGFLFILSRSRLNLVSIGKFGTKAFKKLFLPSTIILVYILTLSMIIWLFLLPTFAVGYTGETFVWYLYPVRLGIALFMAVPVAYQLFRSREFGILKLPIIILLISVSWERALTYLVTRNMIQFAYFSPVRVVEFTWMGVAILAAPALISILKGVANSDHTKRKLRWISKKFGTTVLLTMIVIVGSSSTLYNVHTRSTPSITLTDNELQALDFLRNETPSKVTVLALGYSVNKIDTFGGRFPVMHYEPAIFGADDFEAFIDMIKHNTYELYGHFPIRYFWLSDSDAGEMQKYERGYFIGDLLNYLPVVYANEEVKIFEIPSFFSPSSESDLTVVKSISNISKQNVLMSAIALAGLNYTLRCDFDLKPPSSILFLANDPIVDLNYSVTSKAKRIIVFNTDASKGQFAKTLQINTDTDKTHIVNGISSSSINLSFPPLEIPTFYSLDDDVEPLAHYTRNGQSLSPYAFRKAIGTQEIIYVEIYPYFETLQRNAGTTFGVEMFTKLGALIDVLDLQLPKYEAPSNPMGRAILFGQTTFEGDVSFNVTSFYIPALDSKFTKSRGWKEDTFSANWSTDTNRTEHGSVDVSTDGDVLTVTFDASAKDVWQYLFLKVPEVNVSQFRFLFLKEKIEALSYNLGYLRIVVGGYIYNVRGWTNEIHPPGDSFETCVFDLTNAIPEKSEAPTLPKGLITELYWTGYSTGENGGAAKLYLDYIMLTDSPVTPTNYGEITACLDLSEANSVFIDGIPSSERTFVNVKILDVQISGDFNSAFTSTESRLSPPGLGVYSKIAFNQGCNLTLWLINNSKISFTTLVNEKSSDITVSGGKIHLGLTPLREELVAYVSGAQVTVNGYTKFEKAFMSWPYGIYNPELPMEVNGPITFRVDVMDQDFSLISELKVEGKYQVLTQQQVKWNEWDIPWQTILTSPYHIILVASIVVGLVVHKWRKTHKVEASFRPR